MKILNEENIIHKINLNTNLIFWDNLLSKGLNLNRIWYISFIQLQILNICKFPLGRKDLLTNMHLKGFGRTKHWLGATSGASAGFQIWRHTSVSCPCARRRIYSWTESSRLVWAQIFVGFVHSEQIDSSSRLFQVRD